MVRERYHRLVILIKKASLPLGGDRYVLFLLKAPLPLGGDITI